MRYAIFDADGRILRVILCNETEIACNSQPGEDWVEVGEDVMDDTHYMTGDGAVAMPTQPSRLHTFDYGSRAWVDARSIDECRSAKWNAIKVARDAAEFGGFEWSGNVFDSNPASQSRIQGGVLMAGITPGFSIDWTLADNTIFTLNADDMVAVGVALGAHVATQHSRARTLRQQINEAETIEQVESIAW